VDGRVTTGWHPDPFGVHEARYFNADGQPTKLVRDRGAESYDEPPSGADEVAAAMARMSAVPEPPSAYAPRDPYPYPYHPAAERRRRSRPLNLTLSIIGITLGALAIVGGVTRLMQAPKPASTPGTTGVSDVAFVTQAATRTLQQGTADLVMSATGTSAGATYSVHGTGAFDLAGQAGTLNLTVDSSAYALAFQEILLNGQAYVERAPPAGTPPT
jgi:hypothetical protein